MTRLVQCDRCGKQARDPYRGVPLDERDEVRQAYYEFVYLSVEATRTLTTATSVPGSVSRNGRWRKRWSASRLNPLVAPSKCLRHKSSSLVPA